MDMNGTFNFSLDEAYSILVEHQGLTRNVDKVIKSFSDCYSEIHWIILLESGKPFTLYLYTLLFITYFI